MQYGPVGVIDHKNSSYCVANAGRPDFGRVRGNNAGIIHPEATVGHVLTPDCLRPSGIILSPHIGTVNATRARMLTGPCGIYGVETVLREALYKRRRDY
jgi:hypothetical protein